MTNREYILGEIEKLTDDELYYIALEELDLGSLKFICELCPMYYTEEDCNHQCPISKSQYMSREVEFSD